MRQPACLDRDFHVGPALEITCQYDVNEEARNILLPVRLPRKELDRSFVQFQLRFFPLSLFFYFDRVTFISNISREIILFIEYCSWKISKNRSKKVFD